MNSILLYAVVLLALVFAEYVFNFSLIQHGPVKAEYAVAPLIERCWYFWRHYGVCKPSKWSLMQLMLSCDGLWCVVISVLWEKEQSNT